MSDLTPKKVHEDRSQLQTFDLQRAWSVDPDTLEGHFIMPDLEYLNPDGYPYAKALGNFWYDVNKALTEGRYITLSRWSRFRTPDVFLPEGGVLMGDSLYDGDIVEIHWKVGFRDSISRYSVDYFEGEECRWVMNELGDYPDREFIALAELDTIGRDLMGMKVIGHRWQQKWKNITA